MYIDIYFFLLSKIGFETFLKDKSTSNFKQYGKLESHRKMQILNPIKHTSIAINKPLNNTINAIFNDNSILSLI